MMNIRLQHLTNGDNTRKGIKCLIKVIFDQKLWWDNTLATSLRILLNQESIG